MNCKNCGAPMKVLREGLYFYCEYCSSFQFPTESVDRVRVFGEESSVECPICRVPLVSAAIEGARVLHCTSCRGLLARQTSFVDLIKYLRAIATDPPRISQPVSAEECKRQTTCPVCGETMSTHPYYGPGNVVIDVCTRCQLIWLDYGELDVIVDAPGPDRAR